MQSVKSKTTLTQKFKRKIMSKKMTKYIADFNYFDKALIALSATSGGISTISQQVLMEFMQEQQVQFLLLYFTLTTGMIKKLLELTRNKKKKNNKIVMLAKSKLNSIETLTS